MVFPSQRIRLPVFQHHKALQTREWRVARGVESSDEVWSAARGVARRGEKGEGQRAGESELTRRKESPQTTTTTVATGRVWRAATRVESRPEQRRKVQRKGEEGRRPTRGRVGATITGRHLDSPPPRPTSSSAHRHH